MSYLARLQILHVKKVNGHTTPQACNFSRESETTHWSSDFCMHAGCFEAWTGDWDPPRHYQQGLWWQSSMSTNLFSHQDSVGWTESAKICCTRRSDRCWNHSESLNIQLQIKTMNIRPPLDMQIINNRQWRDLWKISSKSCTQDIGCQTVSFDIQESLTDE